MSIKSRKAAKVLRTRRNANKVLRKIRKGGTTVNSYGRLVGLTAKDAESMGSSLRKNAEKLSLPGQRGVSYAHRLPARECTRYVPSQIVAALNSYRPRKAEFKAAKAELIALFS